MLKKSISFLIAVLFLITPAFALEADSLIPIGHTTGIKMYTDGVVVIKISDVPTEKGKLSPSADIKVGDIITKVNGKEIKNAEDFKAVILKKGNKEVKLTLVRGGKECEYTLSPVKDIEGEYKLGIWVRDSMAGIGTITFYDPKTNIFGALGHGICDSEAGVLIPFKAGSVMESQVDEVKKGEKGDPGELHGNYNLREDYGTLLSNTESGIFGKISDKKEFLNKESVPVCEKSDVRCGPAIILSNVEGDNVAEYKIEIVKIFPTNGGDTKNMMIKVIDENLIKKTGGIVQGMSGSPIMQDGKLVGAVTHVLVNDPTLGYGIFVENMLEKAG